MDEAKNSQQLTFGERAVGLNFNPAQDPKVAKIKEQFAAIVDTLNDYRAGNPGDEHDPDVARMLSVAITEAQTAQMWAVKAVTWGK